MLTGLEGASGVNQLVCDFSSLTVGVGGSSEGRESIRVGGGGGLTKSPVSESLERLQLS